MSCLFVFSRTRGSERSVMLRSNGDTNALKLNADKHDVASGKWKLIGDLSTRDQRKRRKDWKIHQQTTRSKRDGDLMTPPESPENLPDAEMNRSRYLLSVYQATCHICRHEYRYHILPWRTSIHYDRIIR